MTPTEALQALAGALPANPEHDSGSVAVSTDAIRALVDGATPGPMAFVPLDLTGEELHEARAAAKRMAEDEESE